MSCKYLSVIKFLMYIWGNHHGITLTEEPLSYIYTAHVFLLLSQWTKLQQMNSFLL